jgi:hypothetical protein
MARVYSGFSNYERFVGGYQAAAGLYARLAEAARRRLERLRLTLFVTAKTVGASGASRDTCREACSTRAIRA